MSEIRQLDELREYITAEDEISWDGHKTAWVRQDSLLIYLDAIEREIAERFMERPVDADGTPIRMGDAVEGELLDDTTVRGTVCAFHLYDDEPDSVFVHVDVDGGWTIKDLRLTRCRHAKPRTVEDVLRDLADAARLDRAHLLDDGDIDGAAAEIRGLLGVDA